MQYRKQPNNNLLKYGGNGIFGKKIMKTTTYFYNAEGNQVNALSGEPRNASVFERNSADAVRIFIGLKVFNKVNGRWVGEI